jgi:hypothetical protein
MRSAREVAEREAWVATQQERDRAIKVVIGRILSASREARVLLEQLVTMAPGLNRNPFVQRLRTELDNVKVQSELLK